MKKHIALITGVILAAVSGVASAQLFYVRSSPGFVCVQNNTFTLVRACDQFGNCTRILGPGSTGRLVYTNPLHQMMPVHVFSSAGFYRGSVFYPNRVWVSFAKTTYLAPGDRLILGSPARYSTVTGQFVPVLVPSIIRNACGPIVLVR